MGIVVRALIATYVRTATSQPTIPSGHRTAATGRVLTRIKTSGKEKKDTRSEMEGDSSRLLLVTFNLFPCLYITHSNLLIPNTHHLF
jgi:hypothetical protein